MNDSETAKDPNEKSPDQAGRQGQREDAQKIRARAEKAKEQEPDDVETGQFNPD